MILVDSSVWVDYFNGVRSRETDFLDSTLGFEPVATGDLILTEVLQGFRSDSDYQTAKSLLLGLTVFELRGPGFSCKGRRQLQSAASSWDHRPKDGGLHHRYVLYRAGPPTPL
jgi:hypothetical protein